MRALVLAAGYATRLYPLTRNRPKPLLPVGGRPILDYLVDELETLPDLNQVDVVTNHRFADCFRDWAEGRQARVPLAVLDDGTLTAEDRLGALGDIAFGIRARGIDEDLLVLAADNLLPFRFADFAAFAAEKHTDCITCYRLSDENRLRRTGIVARDGEGRVTRFEEKSAQPWSDLAVPPVYLYRRDTLPLFAEYLAAGNNPDAPGHFLPWLIERRPVCAFLFAGEPTDIGTVQSYEAACARWERGQA